MPDIYFHENLMVIPVEGIDAKKVFKPITAIQDCYKSEEKVKEECQKVINVLAAEVPLIFDGTEIPVRQDRRWHFKLSFIS